MAEGVYAGPQVIVPQPAPAISGARRSPQGFTCASAGFRTYGLIAGSPSQPAVESAARCVMIVNSGTMAVAAGNYSAAALRGFRHPIGGR
jgi:hypothetical protein